MLIQLKKKLLACESIFLILILISFDFGLTTLSLKINIQS